MTSCAPADADAPMFPLPDRHRSRRMEVAMDEDNPMPQDLTNRTSRCSACGRPVWGSGTDTDGKPVAPPPELCDYCAAACA